MAAQAGERQVSRFSGSPLLATDDMVDLEGEMGITLLDQAILTQSASPLEDQSAQAR
jgi:hypothetical protein